MYTPNPKWHYPHPQQRRWLAWLGLGLESLAAAQKFKFGVCSDTRRTTSYHQGGGLRRADNQAGAVLMSSGEPGTTPEHPGTHHGALRTRTPEHPGTSRSGANAVRPQANPYAITHRHYRSASA
jgi:hypothetical protein